MQSTEEKEWVRFHATEPPLTELQASFQNCSPAYNGWNRLRYNEEVRFARWNPQWPDGKKYDTKNNPAFPWNGASDVRVFLTDDTINELVAVLVVAFFRSVELVEGVEEGDNEQAANIRTLFRWLMGTRQVADLVTEVELSAQYLLTYGRCVLHPYWQREIQMRAEDFSLEQLQALKAEPGSPLAALAGLIINPTTEDEAVTLLQEIGGKLVQAQFSQALGKDVNDVLRDYKITKKRARRLVKDLREHGKGVIPLPYFCKNGPAVTVLKPWEEVFLPDGMTDIQRGTVLHAKYFTEVEFKAEATVNDWDPEWVEAAIRKKGYYSAWILTSPNPEPNADWRWNLERNEADQKIEVIYASYWQLDEDEDIKWAVCTVFHMDIKAGKDGRPLYGKHGPIDLPHRELPYVLGLLERTDRRIDASRALPERLAPRQREMKVQRDSLIDVTSVSVCPPLIKYDVGIDVKFKYGPLAENMATPGREPKLMDMRSPGVPVAFELWKAVKAEVDNAVGAQSEDVPQVRSVTMKQMMLNTFLKMWTLAFKQEFALIEEYMPDEEYMRITSATAPLPKGDAVHQQYDFILAFDARELDMDHVMKQFEAITKGVLPYDRTNQINTGKMINAQLRAINPALAKEISQTPQEGLAQRKAKVQQDLLLMYTGNDPEYLENGNPAAETDLKLMNEIIRANPKYQEALKTDPDFLERAQKYQKSLQFNIVQGQENPTTGRTGVKAAAPMG